MVKVSGNIQVLYEQPLGSKLIQQAFMPPPTKKNYSALIFDIGRVLLDWQPEYLAKQLSPHPKAADALLAAVQNKIWTEFDRGTASIKDIVQSMNFDDQELSFHLEELLHKIPHHLPIIESMNNLFDDAANQSLKTYLLTNMPAPFLSVIVQKHAFFKKSSGVVASCVIKKIKPEPEIYHYLLQHFNIDPTQALFIDDIEDNVYAATTFGIDGIVCKNHEEVLNIAKQINLIR